MPTKTRKRKAKAVPDPITATGQQLEAEADIAPRPEVRPEPELNHDPRVVGPEPPEETKVVGPSGGFGVPSPEDLVANGEPAIRLKNLRNRPVDIMLDHDSYCAAIDRCVCAERDVLRWERYERKSAAQRLVKRRVKLARTVIIPPLGVSEPLHEAVTKCADVAPKLANRPQKLKIAPV